MADVHKTPESVVLSLQNKKEAEFYQKDFLRQVEKDLTIDLDEIRVLTETIEFDPGEMDKVIPLLCLVYIELGPFKRYPSLCHTDLF